MKAIEIETILSGRKIPFMNIKLFRGALMKIMKNILREKEMNQFLESRQEVRGFDFIDELFEYLDFSYTVASKDKMNIPSEGRLVIVSNHPLGALDGLALLKAVGEVRKDVKIVANNLLLHIDNLSELFLPFDIFSKSAQKDNLKNIQQSINKEEAVIFFPAAEVSRLSAKGIQDGKWRKGAVRLAESLNAPILPIYTEAKNSALFYAMSYIYNPLGAFLLPREMFNKRNDTINIKIGKIISAYTISGSIASINAKTSLLRKHVYKIGKNKKGIFKTENTIIHPVGKKILKDELNEAQLLGITKDQMSIYITYGEDSPNVMKEISRLREITFRKVGEGTGAKQDTDTYDKYYKHLILWDEKNLEIAGSYRIGECRQIISNLGAGCLYNASMYKFSDKLLQALESSIELGRSFVQQKYWRSPALDYLWQGIGAFLKLNPNIRILFGAVSISDSFPDDAKNLIVAYYTKWFSSETRLAEANNRFIIPEQAKRDADSIFIGGGYEEDFRILKKELRIYGYSVPVLFRKYTELCEYGGAKFLDFGVDKDFSTVDGLIMIDLKMLHEDKRKRYFGSRSFVSA